MKTYQELVQSLLAGLDSVAVRAALDTLVERGRISQTEADFIAKSLKAERATLTSVH